MERALIVGVNINGEKKSSAAFGLAMDEMISLVKACDMQPVGRIEQNMEHANTATYIGAGKVEEVRETAAQLEADLVVFDNGLSPIQLRNLQRELNCPVIDRTTLILEIFSSRAQTREAKLQVEVARLQYMLPRLVGLHAALSRQGGASGAMSNKGAGEKKLELDRRRLEQRLTSMKRELEEISGERRTQRKKRAESGLPRVTLVGYTNAGKSTVMNMLLSAYVDKEHSLVKAFRSTLEEVREADLLLQIIDYSDENHREHMRVTADTLRELGAGNVPMLYVFNKADLCGMGTFASVQGDDKIYMSAKSQNGIDALLTLIAGKLSGGYRDCTFLLPYQRGDIVSYLKENAVVFATEYREEGVYMEANVTVRDAGKFQEYLL